MSLPVSTTISGIDSLTVLWQNLAIARGFKPLTPEQLEDLRRRCAVYAADGHLELYKTTKHYDARIGREQHGYPPLEDMPLESECLPLYALRRAERIFSASESK